MAAITGMHIGKDVCKAIGLEGQRVRTIDIHISYKEAVTITVERLIEDEHAKALIPVLEKYQLTAKAEPDVTSMDSEAVETQPTVSEVA